MPGVELASRLEVERGRFPVNMDAVGIGIEKGIYPRLPVSKIAFMVIVHPGIEQLQGKIASPIRLLANKIFLFYDANTSKC